MSWLLGHLLVPAVLSAVLGFVVTWMLLVRRAPAGAETPAREPGVPRRATTRAPRRPAPAERPRQPAADVPGSWSRVGGSGDRTGAPAPADRTSAVLPTRTSAAGAPTRAVPVVGSGRPVPAGEGVGPEAGPAPAPPPAAAVGPEDAPLRRGTTEPARGWGWFEQIAQRSVVAPEPGTQDGGPRLVPLYLQPTPSARFEGAMLPAAGGAAPEGYPVKVDQGLVSYHLPGSPVYEEIRAEVCFADEEAAQRVGFRRWDDTRR